MNGSISFKTQTGIGHGLQQRDAGDVVSAAVHHPVVIAQIAQVEGQIKADVQRIVVESRHLELDDLASVAACLLQPHRLRSIAGRQTTSKHEGRVLGRRPPFMRGSRIGR